MPTTTTTPKPRRLHPRQLEANRRNAQKSTGPRTAQGKATTRLNASRHGLTGQVNILADIERAAIEAFCKPIVNSYAATTPHELQFARAIAEAQWRLNRARVIEENYFAIHTANYADHTLASNNAQTADALHQASGFFQRAADFDRLTLYEQRIQRAMAKNIQLLNESKQQRHATEAKALQAEAIAFEEAQLLRQYATAKGEKFDVEREAKANNGSVYSIEQLDSAIARQVRLREARALLTPPRIPSGPMRPSLPALLRQAA